MRFLCRTVCRSTLLLGRGLERRRCTVKFLFLREDRTARLRRSVMFSLGQRPEKQGWREQMLDYSDFHGLSQLSSSLGWGVGGLGIMETATRREDQRVNGLIYADISPGRLFRLYPILPHAPLDHQFCQPFCKQIPVLVS